MSLWDWTLKTYARPGVEDLLLELQDIHGQSIPLLLWAAWMAGEGRTVGRALPNAIKVAKAWEAEVVAPLRQARRALKLPLPMEDEADRDALRETVKAAELEAERLTMSALARLAVGPRDAPGDLVWSLTAAAHAWNGETPVEHLERLAEACATPPPDLTSPFSRHRQAELLLSNGEADAQAEPDEAVRGKIAILRIEHADLDAAIQALGHTALPDQIQIARLKKKKLILRDQIQRLEDQLTPDIIA